MPNTSKHLEEKTYNSCIDCAHIGKNCDGANFLAMTTDRWCEWCHLRKEYLDWTNEKVADLSGVSLVTVNRVMSGNVKDLRVSTMQAITKALVNGSWGQYPCAMGETETVYVDNPELVEKCRNLQSEIDRLSAEHRTDQALHSTDRQSVDFLKEQIQLKDKLILDTVDRKNRVIRTLVIMLTIAVSIIIITLIVDRLNSDIGFFWIDQLSTVVSSKGTNILNIPRSV